MFPDSSFRNWPHRNVGLFLLSINVYLYIMANQLDVVSLEEAKEFLVIDFDDRDDEIIACIETAVDYIESYTNIMLYQRAKVYTVIGCSIEIYDYPIDLPLDTKIKQNILSVTVFGTDGQEISALVGYVGNSNTPKQLIMACKKMIIYLFENRDVYTAGLPWDIQMLINKNRRSATI